MPLRTCAVRNDHAWRAGTYTVDNDAEANTRGEHIRLNAKRVNSLEGMALEMSTKRVNCGAESIVAQIWGVGGLGHTKYTIWE